MIAAVLIGASAGGFLLVIGVPWWAAGSIAALAGLFQAGAQ